MPAALCVTCIGQAVLGAVGTQGRVPWSALCSPTPCRDAIAKTLYALLFGWLTDRINKLVYPRQDALSIAILDIYGFEVGTDLTVYSISSVLL